MELTPQKLISSLKQSKEAESCPEEDVGDLEGAHSGDGENGEESRSNQLCQKEFLEDLLFNNEVEYFRDEGQEPNEWFESLMEKAPKDDDDISLLDDFGEDDSLEDPFAFGTENIMKDIMQDELFQRSISKLS